MGKPRNTQKYPKYPEIPESKKDTQKYPIVFFDTPSRPATRYFFQYPTRPNIEKPYSLGTVPSQFVPLNQREPWPTIFNQASSPADQVPTLWELLRLSRSENEKEAEMRKRMECRWAKKSQRSLRGARSNQRGSVSHPLVWGQSLHMGASAIRIWVSVDRQSGSKNLGS